jgi:hypothetical protein
MATKAFDISKFRKTLTKSIDGLGLGFNDPTDWISTGNYALNYLMSGDFDKGIPLARSQCLLVNQDQANHTLLQATW